MIGCDADSLEMRCLAGYLKALDNGKFMESILTGKKEDGTDAHTINMKAYQIEDREAAKGIFYGDIYGSRNAKKGVQLMEAGVDFIKYVPEFEKNLEGILKWESKKNAELAEAGKLTMTLRSQAYWECWIAGKHCSELFGNRIPELNLLKERIHSLVEKKGWIKGLDGRKLFMRSEHSELNTVLQSAGALIMKKALCLADESIQKAGLVAGKDYEFILWVHDEFEVECIDNPTTIDIISRCLVESIEQAGKEFNFPCPMKGNVKVGKSWAEVH
jgi:DNA polymerase I-like protein with 3'-5' exonuclease and polymerase domains